MEQATESSTPRTSRRYREGDDRYKRWQDKIFQGDQTYKCPTYVLSTPPCQGACPAGEDIRGYLNIVRGIEKPPLGPDGKPSMPWEEYAWRRITEANPFPAIMGRVCPAPCQGGCNRGKVDDFVGVNSVEHYLGDWAIEHKLAFAAPAAETGKRVAIIGGGVAGLSCAYQLRRQGHACTIFESNHRLGGMISFGLPHYRTPREVVDAEVQRILDMGGIEVRLNTRIGRDVGFVDLKRNFDAVFVGIGANQGNRLDIPGADAPNCIDGLTFLYDFNDGRKSYAGRQIVVIGGGDTAMDCASVARRLGAYNADAEAQQETKVIMTSPQCLGRSPQRRVEHWRQHAEVIIAYRRQVKEMPAAPHEIDAVLEEGVDIRPCVIPIAVVKDENGLATALRVARVEWVNKQMVPQPGSEYDIPCDLIVSAVGQSVNWTGMDKLKNDKGLAKVDNNLATEPGVFVGGDAIKPLLLTTAIGHGRIAAEGIHRYLAGQELDGRPKVDVKWFSLTDKMIEAGFSFGTLSEPTHGTDTHPGVVHNHEDRSRREIIGTEALFLGHFPPLQRHQRELRIIDETNVLGCLEERLMALDAAQVQAEAKRCMSCGLCFECDNCVMYCPQGAVRRVPKKEATTGHYVVTDYDKCVGCHICADVCPTGYIRMGLGMD